MAVLTSSLAVALSLGSFLVYDLISFRQLLSQDLITQAQIISYNSAAAMAFKDVSAAEGTISALTAKADVVAAVLYTTDGKIFARYSRSGGALRVLPAIVGKNGYRLNGNYIDVFNDVKLKGERVGTLFLQSDLERWKMRARRNAGIFVILGLSAGLFAWFVSFRLQTLVSGPILHLDQTMQAISQDRNYAVRAVKSTGDEIGRLIVGFNRMLSEIQHRDAALQRANDDLKARTGELEQETVHRREAQQELLNAKHAAEQASRAKGSFLANMSHELRTPLNAIIGYSEMLEEETHDTGQAETVRDLRKIQTAGRHLLSLINDVLDLSKIEAGRMALHLETFELRPMAKEMVEALLPAAEKNFNRIVVSLADDLGSMHADAAKVRHILFNLLSNACKFTDHGIITFDVQRQEGNPNRFVFRVTDTGIGMTPEHQWKLFQYFAQADASIARKYGGTGLGLAISSRFAEMMQGNIHVDSRPGEGSTFTLDLPAAVNGEAIRSPSVQVQTETPVESSVNPEADTILVIDDDPTVRDLMTRFVAKRGFRPVPAADGQEGLRLAREIRPRVITLDVVMPSLDGWDVLDQLKSDPQLSSIPVIMVTIVDNQAYGMEHGVSEYLVKPIDRERLAVTLDKYRTRPIQEIADQ